MKPKKTNSAAELWKLTLDWLSLLGNRPNAKFCREEITTHPDYPAMTAVTDFLDAGNMQYNAVQADASYIHEFNYPLLAHISQPGEQYLHIISNATEWDRQKEITQHWSGIVLFPEKNTSWQNEQNNVYVKEAFKTKIFVTIFITVALGLFVASSLQQANIATMLFGLLSLFGLVISIFLLGTELGYQSQLVKQVCGTISNGGCEKVLRSKYAKGFFGVTPADASVLYFAAQFAFYLLHPYFAGFLNCLLLIAFCGSVIAVWSIYTQAVKLKEWCAVCLGIVAILVLQTAIALLITNFQFLHLISLQPFFFFALLMAILCVALVPVKGLIKTNMANQHILTEFKKWKSDAGLFISQWQQEQKIDTTIWENDLVLGNPDAPILITVACNPYCGPCAKAHANLEELMQYYQDKIKIQIRLLCNLEDENNRLTIAVKAILQKTLTCKKNKELDEMLSDWFIWMDLQKWNTKWQPDNSIDVQTRLEEHNNWITENKITATPTFFVNGKKLPGRYSLKDIEILLPQLLYKLTVSSIK